MDKKLPQTVANEVTEALNALIAQGDHFRDWNAPEIRELFHQIEKLQKVDARNAFVRYGCLAAICARVDDVLEYFRKALQHPDVFETNHEYWGAVVNAGMYSKAHEIGNWMLEPRRQFFPGMWRKAVSLGLIQGVWARVPDATRTFPDLGKEDFSLVEEAAQLMRQRGLKDQNIAAVFDMMGEIQREQGYMFAGKLVSALRVIRPPEEPPYLYFTLWIDASSTVVHAMNRKLVSKVVEKLGAFPSGIVATFAKAPQVELRAAA
jgi:hypothetical protein